MSLLFVQKMVILKLHMKLNRTHLFIAISSAALIIVLIIQVNWIFETAKIKEELFNEKANMVLSKTAEALSRDTLTYKKLNERVSRNKARKKIDSLFNHYMQVYNIRIGYFFEIKPGFFTTAGPKAGINSFYSEQQQQQGCYQTCVKDGEDVGGTDNTKGLELKLVFPEKEEFIIQEMGIPFISSVLLILVVLVLSGRTILSLMKEKKISEHTTDFLNNMTHEFKTPLTNIALAGKMMIKESNIRQEDKVKHYSGIILAENEKLRLQVEQVLSMTALERGEIPLRRTELDAHQLILEALKCISVQIESRQGQLHLHLDAASFVLMGDKTHLTNAMCNLVDNAIKYSKERPELSITTRNRDGCLELVVSDNGIGIEEEYQKRVFEKFFRVPTGDVHNVKGFGLGLAYIKTIIEMHNGTIELRSEKNKGTTFTILLPNV